MTQEPSVLLVELSEKSVSFSQALSQVGRASVALTLAQLEPALAQGSPLCIVAPAEHVSTIMERMRAAGLTAGLPFFVLTKETPGSKRPPLPDVTACVPEGIDPGILALRIQQALQMGGPRARQPTVLGMGSMSRPQALPSTAPSSPPPVSAPLSAPPARPAATLQSAASPAAAPVSRPVVPPSKSPSASAPPAPPAPPTPPSVPWDEPARVVSSAPALGKGLSPSGGPSSQPPSPPKPSRGVVSSAPPLPEISSRPSSPPLDFPAAAPLPGEIPQPPLSSPPVAASSPPSASSSPPVSAVPSHPPVALNAPPAVSGTLDLDEDFGQKKSPWLKRGLLGAVAAAAIAAGGIFVLGEKSDTAPDPANAGANAEPESADAAKGNSPSPVGPEGSQPAPTEPEKPAEKPAEEPADEDTLLFKISAPQSLPSCEKVLGKSKEDFAKAKKWRAAQVWKLARQNLLAGKEEKALEYMCEGAFIDAGGPAAVGLSKYYLGKRSLDEAHAWAERALEAAPGAVSKRTAQQALGDVLSQMGKMDEARAAWLESFNLKAEQKDRLGPVCRNFVTAATKSRKGGDPATAEQLLRRAAAFTPEDANTAALLALTLLDNEQPELAKRWAERALKLKPGTEMAQEVLSKL